MVKQSTRVYQRVGLVNRARIIALSKNGQSQRSISKELKIKRVTVQAIIRKSKSTDILKDLPKKGRPSIIDDGTKRLLTRLVLRGEVTSATELAQVALRHHQVDISASTARRLLHEQGLSVRHTIKKPLLTVDHKRKRLEYALAHRDWTVNHWKRIIFSDETVIPARPVNPHKLVWTKHTDHLDPKLIIPTVQGGGVKLMGWGCISTHGFHDFVQLEDSINAIGYIKILDTYLLPVIADYFLNKPCIFQQDGASVHTANATREFFKRKRMQVLEWPPHSPDLNIIEHVWHYLKKELYKTEPAKNKEELWTKIAEVVKVMWSPEMTERINDLYESMPNRIAAVIGSRGGNTKY